MWWCQRLLSKVETFGFTKNYSSAHSNFVFFLQQIQVVLDLSLPKHLKTKVEVPIMLKMSEDKCLRLVLGILAYNTLEKVPMEW